MENKINQPPQRMIYEFVPVTEEIISTLKDKTPYTCIDRKGDSATFYKAGFNLLHLPYWRILLPISDKPVVSEEKMNDEEIKNIFHAFATTFYDANEARHCVITERNVLNFVRSLSLSSPSKDLSDKQEVKGKSMIDFILEIDRLTTNEFCEKYQVPKPKITGHITSTVDSLLQVDAIKHRMFVQKAKDLFRNNDQVSPPIEGKEMFSDKINSLLKWAYENDWLSSSFAWKEHDKWSNRQTFKVVTTKELLNIYEKEKNKIK